MRRLEEGLDERVGAASFTRSALRRPFPDHWSFMLGEIALFCFVILVLTGTFLSFFYRASSEEVTYVGPYAPLNGQPVTAAYDSVLRLSFEVRAGLVMRQLHHWAAVVFVTTIVAHLIRVFFTGAFRKPRDINWVIGFTLLLLGIGAGFTGYSLPDDLLSGTGVRIAYSAVLSIPVLGTWLASLLFGGEFPTADLLSRLTILHVMVIPVAIAGAVSAHLALVWRQKHTQFPGPGRTEDTVTGSALWPTYAMKSTGLFFVVAAVLALLAGLVQINPVWIYGPFRPWLSSSPAQPDIYVGWLDGALRLAPAWEPHIFGHTIPEPFLPGVVVPGVFFTIVALWPFIESRVTGDRGMHHLLQRPRDAPVRTGFGVAGATFIVILTLAGSNDLLAKAFNVEVETINAIDKVALVAGPLILGFLADRICRELRRRELRPVTRPPRVRIARTAGGGFAIATGGADADGSPTGLRDEADDRQDRDDRPHEQDA